MTERSWSPRDYGDTPPEGYREPLPPLRLTRLGRQALAITVTALLVLSAAIGFLIRTPLDKALADCGDITQPCQMPQKPSLQAPSERTP